MVDHVLSLCYLADCQNVRAHYNGTQIEWSRQHKETQRSPERAVLSQLIENT